MDLTPELFDEIDAYIYKRMTPEELTQFSQRMVENNQLRQEVDRQERLHVGLDAALHRQQAKSDAATISIQQQFAQVRFERQQQRQRQRRVYAIAASIALLLISFVVVLINQLNWSSAEVAFASYYQPEPRVRADEAMAADLVAAQNDYYAGQYERALTRLNATPDDSLYRVTYYRGLTQLALNQTENAELNLQKARKSPDPIIQRRAAWYLSLSILKTDEPQRAIPLLRQIANNPRQPYREQAARIISDLQ